MATPSNLIPGSGAGIRGGLDDEKNVFDALRENTNVYARRYQSLLDRSTPHVMERWLVTGTLVILFSLSVIVRQGWYIIMCECDFSVTAVVYREHELISPRRPRHLHSQPLPCVPPAAL
jgi:hypothetical protein